MAQNINRFTPSPSVGYDKNAYLIDINFHLQSLDHTTNQDKIYLIRIMSSLEVHSLLNQ